MGTRSYIALQIEEDEYLTIFCHYNGYPDDNGAILAEHYDKQEKVESLIQLGDLYFLRSKLEPNPDLPHNHSTPQPNVTIAYMLPTITMVRPLHSKRSTTGMPTEEMMV